ncbi:hypothetical protein A6R68_07279, partial [Neotoma lepida]
MPSPRRTIEGRPLGASGGSSVPGSPAHGGGGGGRFEFQSLLSGRAGADPACARLRASDSPVHRRGSFPLASAGPTHATPTLPPEDDRMNLNPSFLGIALRSLLAIDLIMLGRHNVTDVAFGFFLGYMLYSIVDYCWLSPHNVPALFVLWNQ